MALFWVVALTLLFPRRTVGGNNALQAPISSRRNRVQLHVITTVGFLVHQNSTPEHTFLEIHGPS
jgi:hypothetical protein